jgi:hypothetical protein
MSGAQRPAIISFAELELRSRFPVELNPWVYVFGAQRFYNGLKNIEIRQENKWLEISDHMPVICEFEENDKQPHGNIIYKTFGDQ